VQEWLKFQPREFYSEESPVCRIYSGHCPSFFFIVRRRRRRKLRGVVRETTVLEGGVIET
jgi:hypothetical protein